MGWWIPITHFSSGSSSLFCMEIFPVGNSPEWDHWDVLCRARSGIWSSLWVPSSSEIPWSYKPLQRHFRSSCVWLQSLNLSYIYGPKINSKVNFLHQFPLGKAPKMKEKWDFQSSVVRNIPESWQFHKKLGNFLFFSTKRKFKKMILDFWDWACWTELLSSGMGTGPHLPSLLFMELKSEIK